MALHVRHFSSHAACGVVRKTTDSTARYQPLRQVQPDAHKYLRSFISSSVHVSARSAASWKLQSTRKKHPTRHIGCNLTIDQQRLLHTFEQLSAVRNLKIAANYVAIMTEPQPVEGQTTKTGEQVRTGALECAPIAICTQCTCPTLFDHTIPTFQQSARWLRGWHDDCGPTACTCTMPAQSIMSSINMCKLDLLTQSLLYSLGFPASRRVPCVWLCRWSSLGRDRTANPWAGRRLVFLATPVNDAACSQQRALQAQVAAPCACVTDGI